MAEQRILDTGTLGHQIGSGLIVASRRPGRRDPFTHVLGLVLERGQQAAQITAGRVQLVD